nr:MAG TPA: hypothetical protein [Caudoviricetes sp.]
MTFLVFRTFNSSKPITDSRLNSLRRDFFVPGSSLSSLL